MQSLSNGLIAPNASRILRPGLRSLPPGVERHVVAGGGSMVVKVVGGDRFLLTDIEGGQACEIAFCDGEGRFDLSAIGAKADGGGEGLKQALTQDSEGARRTLTALQRRGIDPGRAKSLRLFGGDGRAGATAEFTVGREGTLVVGAPGEPMSPGEQNTATEIELRIARASDPGERREMLPEPLGDPLQD